MSEKPRKNPCEFSMEGPTELFEALGEGVSVRYVSEEEGYEVSAPGRESGKGKYIITAVNVYMVKNVALYNHEKHTYVFKGAD